MSPYGVYDLSGNLWEWCRTETEPGRFVLKGSAFTSPFEAAAASATNDASAEMLDDDTGFRCVSPPAGIEDG
jgi:formylglycine-generating enzyme required for sulfatase activity